jgi:phosphate starvation-inducible protein PhoH and related proteins
MSKKKRTQKEEVGGTVEIKRDKSQKVPQRDKLKQELSIYTRDDYTEKQKYLIDLILDKKTNIVFVSGCAGTSKTHIAVYAGLKALSNKSQSDILYLRSAVESASKSLGALPGEVNDKIGPYLIPLQDKLEEMLPKCEVDALIKDQRIQGNVVNYIRGASWNAKYIIVDESQNLTKEELKTVLSRMGKYSKLIICGDPDQSDLKEKSGFMDMFDKFNSPTSEEYGIYCFSFSRADIVRSKFLGYILDVIEGTYTPELQ